MVKKRFMIDLETLGNTPGCIVLSVSIVCIEEPELNRTWTLNVGEQLGKGMHIDQGTLDWWMKQDSKVRRQQFGGNAELNIQVLNDIIGFVEQEFPQEYELWSDSPRLDYGCFDALLKSYFLKYPIFHRNERCLRTLMRIADDLRIEYIPLKKTHDPYEDCVSQIETFVDIQQKIGMLAQ